MEDATLFDDKKDSGYIAPVEADAVPMTTEVVAPLNNPADSAIGSLVQLAVEKDFDAEKLDKVITLFNQQQDRQRKETFELHFAEMQKELPIITKDKSAKDKNGKDTYRYATLENVLSQVTPIIAKHGFSYAWRNETCATGQVRVWCAISGYGHTRESYFDIPILDASSWTNSIQQMGSAASYGKRYSLCNALGIIIKDEDDDASSFDLESIMATAKPLAEIKATKTLDELAAKWTAIYSEYKSDEVLLGLLIKAKDAQKKVLK
jgi:hypothetical protein